MKIKGNKKDNTLVGEDGDDKILGLGGDDNITAKGGHDTVDGGAGNDTIKIAANTSADVDAGKGDDAVTITAGALGSSIDLDKGNDSVQIAESSQSNQNFSVDGGKGDNSVDFALDQISYTITENGDAAYTVVDANGNSYALSSISSLSFNGVGYIPPVVEPNQAPVVSTQIADQTSTANTTYSFQVSGTAFTDPDGDALTYSATLANGNALPTWLTFDATSRTFSGTPGATDVGAISVRVTASDGSLSSSDDFTITVNPQIIGPVIPNPVVTAGVLQLTGPYDYDVRESGSDILVTFEGRTRTYDASSITGVKTVGSASVDVNTVGWTLRGIEGDVNYTNVTFTQAGPGDPDVPFSSSFALVPGAMPVNGDVTVNGGVAGYFRAAWDYLDSNYPSGEANNSAFVDLGIEYAKYLRNGGEPLIDDIAKYTDSNNDLVAERSQTLHDNLLGNLDETYFFNKFGTTPGGIEPGDIYDRIVAAGLQEYVGAEGIYTDGRGSFTGNATQIGEPAHLQVLKFDYAHGFERDDYNSFTSSGTVDAAATNGAGSMRFGGGNTSSGYAINQHEVEGIETALKVHLRQGADIVGTVGSDGVVTYDVPTGAQPNPIPNPSWGPPAAWNFDYSIVTGLNGATTDVDDFDFVLRIDTDSSGDVDYVDFNLVATGAGGYAFVGPSPTDVSGGANYGNAHIAQDSINFGFDFIETKIDGGAYAFGTGEFDIELIAYEKGSLHTSSDILSNVHIQVLV